jgi:hypothetical protein
VVDFLVSNNNNGLFLLQPVISPAGTLVFSPQPNVSGIALVTVLLHDSGGVAGGGVDTSGPQTFTITVNKPNPWHNTASLAAPKVGPLDVDLDGSIAPIDAVLVINYLNSSQPDAIPANAPIGGPNGIGPGRTAFIDTGGGENGGPDNFVSPIDAVLVINWLNAFPPGAAAGEGELSSLPQANMATAPPSFGDLIALLAFDAEEAARARRRRF